VSLPHESDTSWKADLMAKSQAATRNSWRWEPLPARRMSIELSLRITPAEFERLRAGSIPDAMEDKWFLFYEDGWLYCHRSWTGYCLYQMRIEPSADGYLLRECWANRDPEQYTNENPAIDVATIETLLNLYFGIRTTRSRNAVGDGLDAVRHWSLFGKRAFE
jgi:hypothetical protein